MTYLFAVIGIALVLGVWALYVRVGVISDAQMLQSEQALEKFKHELSLVWVAISSNPIERAERREKFGFAALYIFDELISDYFGPHRRHYEKSKEQLKNLDSRTWDYTDVAERDRKAKQREELRLEVGALSANLTAEQKAVWDKLFEERINKSLEPYLGKQK